MVFDRCGRVGGLRPSERLPRLPRRPPPLAADRARIRVRPSRGVGPESPDPSPASRAARKLLSRSWIRFVGTCRREVLDHLLVFSALQCSSGYRTPEHHDDCCRGDVANPSPQPSTSRRTSARHGTPKSTRCWYRGRASTINVRGRHGPVRELRRAGFLRGTGNSVDRHHSAVASSADTADIPAERESAATGPWRRELPPNGGVAGHAPRMIGA